MDHRGRLAGLVNLLDAAAVLAVILIVVTAYSAFLLFRPRPARISEIRPSILYQGPNLRVHVSGTNLRPFMRVSFGAAPALTFDIGSTSEALVELPYLKGGVYDAILYDRSGEIARIPRALTILPVPSMPAVDMDVAGVFRGLSDEAAKALKPAQPLSVTRYDVGEILTVGVPTASDLHLSAGGVTVSVPRPGVADVVARLRLNCYVESNPGGSLRCLVPGPAPVAVAPNALLTLMTTGGLAAFEIREVFPPSRKRVN